MELDEDEGGAVVGSALGPLLEPTVVRLKEGGGGGQGMETGCDGVGGAIDAGTGVGGVDRGGCMEDSAEISPSATALGVAATMAESCFNSAAAAFAAAAVAAAIAAARAAGDTISESSGCGPGDELRGSANELARDRAGSLRCV